MSSHSLLPVKQEHVTINRLPSRLPTLLRYRLLRVPHENGDLFYIHVRMGQERCTLPLPVYRSEDAKAKFEQIVRGSVTPCTLADVLEDMKE